MTEDRKKTFEDKIAARFAEFKDDIEQYRIIPNPNADQFADLTKDANEILDRLHDQYAQKLQVQANTLLSGAGYSNTTLPTGNMVLSGLSSLFRVFGVRYNSKTHLPVLKKAYEVVSAFVEAFYDRNESSDEARLWTDVLVDADLFCDVVAPLIDKEKAFPDGFEFVHETEFDDAERLKHFAQAYLDGQPFIVAKLAYGGGEA